MKDNDNPKRVSRNRKERLDRILVERGFFSSRSRAQAAVLAGIVRVDGQVADKAGLPVSPESAVTVDAADDHVSRGGIKLERAFAAFPFSVEGRTALDAGASTGGFTETLLRHGAAHVIAVDVGYGQLDWKLRGDERVQVLERTNVRYLEPELLARPPEVATLDLSFISLKKVLPAVIKCLRPGFEIVALVKPQFEAGKNDVGKGGVVRDAAVHRRVLQELWRFFEDQGCRVRGLTDSGLPGPSGNVEFLLYAVDGTAPREGEPGEDADEVIRRAVAAAREPKGEGR